MSHDDESLPVADPSLLGILEELKAREPIFHRPEFGTTREDFERMTDSDFWEVGASGRRYLRSEVLDALDKRFSTSHTDIWEASDFRCLKLSTDTFLLTYTLIQDKIRRTRRATIWRRSPDGWKIVYHQGTMIQED
jgi:hypothetical protein